MMKKILEIENTQSSDFIPKILNGLKDILTEHGELSKDSETLLTRKETAEMLSISHVTLWKYTKNNLVPAYHIGTKVRYKKNEILLALKKMNQF